MFLISIWWYSFIFLKSLLWFVLEYVQQKWFPIFDIGVTKWSNIVHLDGSRLVSIIYCLRKRRHWFIKKWKSLDILPGNQQIFSLKFKLVQRSTKGKCNGDLYFLFEKPDFFLHIFRPPTNYCNLLLGSHGLRTQDV